MRRKMILLIVLALCGLAIAVGSTRIAGQAGPVIDLKSFLAGNLTESQIPVVVNNIGWTYGTSANQVNVIYADTITLADDANDTLDLYASGSLLDIHNRALTMTALKFLYVKNNSSDAALQLFGGASNDLDIIADTSDVVKVKPGGTFLWTDTSAAGLVITTNKNLRIEHDGTGSSTMDVDVIAMGLD